ncbi:hypothetical protein APUTEX25_002412, partial [Auxenochlorella protothecoides]
SWYFIYFSAGGCLNPFLTLLYREKGLSEARIGELAALRPLVSLPAGYAWSALADRRGWHRRIMLGTLCAATLFKLSQWGLGGLWPLALAIALGQAFDAPVTALVDASVVAACAVEEDGDYSRVRLFGAVGWGIWAAAGGGLLGTLGWPSLFLCHALLTCLLAWPSARLSFDLLRGGPGHVGGALKGSGTGAGRGGDQERGGASAVGTRRQVYVLADVEEAVSLVGKASKGGEGGVDDGGSQCASIACDTQPAGAGQSAPVGQPSPSGRLTGAPDPPSPGQPPAWRLLIHPPILAFLASVAVMGYAMGAIESFLFLALRDLGGPPALAGLTLTVTCVAEPIVFWHARRLQAALGRRGCLHLVFAAFLARLACYATLRGWPSPWLVLPVELLHGFTFGLAWATGTAWAAAEAPPGRKAGMQAAFQGSYMGLGYGLGSLISGAIYSRSGATSVFAWAFAVVACGWGASTVAFTALDAVAARRGGGSVAYRGVELAPREGLGVEDP